MTIALVRNRFPMLETKVHGLPCVYLDSAATALKPASVIDAMHQFYTQQYGTVHRAIYHFAKEASTMYHGVRKKVQNFLNAEFVEEIVFTRGTTDAINLIARSLGEVFFEEGDEIVIPETEHHSNIVPWQMLATRTGARVIPIPVDDDGVVLLGELKKRISVKTRIVSFAHISNFTGALQPVKEIVALARDVGALIVLDAAQSVSHMSIDVRNLDVDFLAFSGHKAFGPTGVGILYGKKRLLDMMPPIQGGGDMIEEVDWSGTRFQETPLKFEAGTPMIAEVIGLGAAIDFIEEIGRETIASYEKELLQYATQKMKGIEGLKIHGDASQKGALISFSIQGCHPLDLGTFLDLKGIALRTGHLCTQPAMRRFGITSALRVSFAPYNTFEEIDFFIEALQESILALQGK